MECVRVVFQVKCISRSPQAEFHHWFKTNKPKEMRESMIKSVWQKAGLGESPPPFCKYLSESLNRQLKWQVESVLIERMRDLAHLQDSQLYKAIIRKRSWCLDEQFADLEIPCYIWFTAYTKTDRERRLSTDFSKVTLATGPLLPLLNLPCLNHMMTDTYNAALIFITAKR